LKSICHSQTHIETPQTKSVILNRNNDYCLLTSTEFSQMLTSKTGMADIFSVHFLRRNLL
jgi:hypothetical protein